jgi:hypothetical protein
MANLADFRKDNSLAGLSEKDLARDPSRLFARWYQEAEVYFHSRPQPLARPSPLPPWSGRGRDRRTAFTRNIRLAQ